MQFLQKLLVLFIVFPLHAHNFHGTKHGTVNVMKEKNAIIKHYVSSDQEFERLGQLPRTIDFPTQIIRVSGAVNEPNISCDEVHSKISEEYLAFVTDSRSHTYNSTVFCGYNPKTGMAERFVISTYFDPLTDSAVHELKDWIESMNGTDLYGTPFIVESARELVVSLKLSAGVKENERDLDFLVYKRQTANYYFNTGYQMKNELTADIRQRFYSFDQKVVLPFLTKWFYPSSAITYKKVLSASNYVLLEPELIFLMDKEPKIFSPMTKLNFAHSCFKSPTTFCL